MNSADPLQIKREGSSKRAFESSGDSIRDGYTPLKKTMDDSFQYLRQQLIKKLKRNDLKTLEKEIKSRSDQFIIQFFEAEYSAIFYWLLISSTNTSSFELILNMFPRDIFQEKLRENDFLFLTNFLNSRAGMESLGLLSSDMRKLDVERFKLLFKIDSEGIKDFMKKNKEARFMKPSIWEDYELGLASYQSTKTEQLK